jgi:hypothetical protein
MKTDVMRLTKREWYAMGGFANPHLYRRHDGRSWHYFMGMN